MNPTGTRSVHRHAIGALVLATLVLVIVITGAGLALAAGTLLGEIGYLLLWWGALLGLGAWCVPLRWFEAQATSEAARGDANVLRSTMHPTNAPRGAISQPAGESRALWLATTTGVGAGIVSLLVLLLGLTGWLTRASAWGLIGSGLLLLIVFVSRKRFLHFANWRSIAVSRASWLWLCVAPAGAVLIVAPAVLPGVLWGDEPHGYDVVEYHLQIPREWHDAGRITRLDHNAFSHLPFGMEMHFLLAMHLRGGPHAGMYLAQYMHAVMAVLIGIAAYGALGGRATMRASVGGAIALATPWTAVVATVAYNEAALMLYAALSVAWLWRAVERGCIGRSVVAGAMAGFATGAKLTAGPMLLVPGVVALLLVGGKARWRLGAGFALVAFCGFAPWAIRNLAWTGNPVFPESTAVFGDGGWSPQRLERWRVAHQTVGGAGAASIADRAAAGWTQVLADWRYGFVLVPAAAGAMLLSLRGGGASSRVMTIVIGLGVVFWIALTHTQGRFLTPLIPLAAMAIGQVLGEGSTWRRGVAACVCVTLAGAGIVPVLRLMQPANQIYGVTDVAQLAQLQPPEVQQAMASGRAIALAGDARAFWWAPSSGRVSYRTVFDVDRRAGESLIDAWTRGAPADAVVVVDPNELRRLTRTYRGLGDAAEEIGDRTENYVAGKAP